MELKSAQSVVSDSMRVKAFPTTTMQFHGMRFSLIISNQYSVIRMSPHETFLLRHAEFSEISLLCLLLSEVAIQTGRSDGDQTRADKVGTDWRRAIYSAVGTPKCGQVRA